MRLPKPFVRMPLSPADNSGETRVDTYRIGSHVFVEYAGDLGRGVGLNVNEQEKLLDLLMLLKLERTA